MAGKADSEITVVLAGNYREFLRWCQENEVNPRDRSVVYASDVSRVRGLGLIRVETYGAWHRRQDGYDIFFYLRAVEKRYATSEG
jgi:hypothetical protein